MELTRVYPKQALIETSEWQQIHDYIIENAPESIPNDHNKISRNAKLFQFRSQLTSNDMTANAGITSIQYSQASQQLLIGDSYGRIKDWDMPESNVASTNSPITSCLNLDGSYYYTEIGYMNPSEQARGVLYKIDSSGSSRTLFNALHRPVYTEIIDLNNDGINEIIICEFGHLTGELSMLVERNGKYEKRTLLSLPGFIKIEVEDLDGDGTKDIIALAGQGKEGIYVFYQKENLEFEIEHVIELSPEFGSSWFELVDYNMDGYKDIVLVNGDNADYSIFMKPYHGIRLYLNNGKNEFEEKWFYPINGATRMLARDFDMDGDIDFAILSAFPDLEKSPEESFVYLENKNSDAYSFESFTTENALNSRWLLMDGGDIDHDGDIDIMLGAYYLPTSVDPNSTAEQRMRNSTTNLLYLENVLMK